MSKTECIDGICPASKNMNFFINVVLHMFILLCIISAFFFFYVSKLSSEVFKNELDDIITNHLQQSLRNADKNNVIKNTLNNVDLNRYVSYYQNRTDRASEIQNTWLERVTLVALACLLFTIILSIVILKFSCQQSTPFTSILKENIILFLFVGVVEVSFFIFIARKYIPTKPSLMMQTIIDSVKKSFRN